MFMVITNVCGEMNVQARSAICAHLVKHEMVHWLQFQEFGALGTMRKPFWLREGMAYSLSAAPAWDIPQQHSKLVLQYEAWARGKEMHDILKIKETNTESIKP